MNFLNVGPFELVMIVLIAILVVGPQRMVELVRSIGRLAGQLRKFSAEFTSMLQAEVLSAEVAETGKETRKTSEDIIEGVARPVASIQAELLALEKETRRALERAMSEEEKAEAGELVEQVQPVAGEEAAEEEPVAPPYPLGGL
ncbi:MAG: twin-arginine translocase TatA/TatE family subunit [Anaerolineae bacterium]|nr:twin-arginine translocase TatA/TatE family subunit [Anaerolineae bacterium]